MRDAAIPPAAGDPAVIPVRHPPLFVAACYVFGVLIVMVSIGLPLGTLADVVWARHDIEWPLVLVVVFAVPCYFFARVGIIMLKSVRVALWLGVGSDGLSLSGRQTMPWAGIQSVIISGRGTRAAFIVRATPSTDLEKLVGDAGTFQWCKIRLSRTKVTPEELRSLLIRLAPQEDRSRLGLGDWSAGGTLSVG